nr:transmembrane protein 117-like [Penaeus vannamei]
MILDLNMWKNQIFYEPGPYGQYIDPVSRKVYTVEDSRFISENNETTWAWEARGEINGTTGKPYREQDMCMYSRYMGYTLSVKCTAFIPNILGLVMLFTLVSLYGRFPPNQAQQVIMQHLVSLSLLVASKAPGLLVMSTC